MSREKARKQVPASTSHILHKHMPTYMSTQLLRVEFRKSRRQKCCSCKLISLPPPPPPPQIFSIHINYAFMRFFLNACLFCTMSPDNCNKIQSHRLQQTARHCSATSAKQSLTTVSVFCRQKKTAEADKSVQNLRRI